MLEESDPVVQAAVLGKQVDDFLASDIGKYIISRAEEESRVAMDRLRVVSPWRRRRIMELQVQAGTGDRIRRWLLDAYQEGIVALNELEER